LNLKKEKIGVLMGGVSSERDISLISGKTVSEALLRKGYEVIPLDLNGENAIKPIKTAGISLAFIALHGRYGEDGTVQRILESLSIPYTGSGVKASRLAMDKVASRRIFAENHIPVPEYRVYEKSSYSPKSPCNPPKPSFIKGGRGGFQKGIAEDFTFPVVVKPAAQGSSIGLSIVKIKEGLRRAVETALEFGDKVIIEQYIKGREITVGVLNEKPLPVIEIRPRAQFYNYRAKYRKGMTEYLVPAPIGKKKYTDAGNIALASHKALGCRDFSRVDMILADSGEIKVLEVNTIPGLTAASLLPRAAQAKGIDYADLCVKILKLALKRKA